MISPKDTGHNEEREARLLERCPPGHEGTKLVDIPMTVLDATGAIIVWYLPDALTETTQEILAASDLLSPSLAKSVKVDGSWRTNQDWFKPSSENDGISPGCINLSPAWFQQGHKVGSHEMAVSDSYTDQSGRISIARLAAFASAALRVMHPDLGQSAESKNLLRMSETLQYWASVFNTLTVISNRQTPNHRDHIFIPEYFNILTTVGSYSNACMSMPSLQL
ncbi:uncharacterized protein EDB91DRAFT_1064239, partial [Suillus paluster]|uniref:uncharacterized protein n=1 Tax=Suillus paluster TaxID=48578 RepID=UPI001B87E3CE